MDWHESTDDGCETITTMQENSSDLKFLDLFKMYWLYHDKHMIFAAWIRSMGMLCLNQCTCNLLFYCLVQNKACTSHCMWPGPPRRNILITSPCGGSELMPVSVHFYDRVLVDGQWYVVVHKTHKCIFCIFLNFLCSGLLANLFVYWLCHVNKSVLLFTRLWRQNIVSQHWWIGGKIHVHQFGENSDL